MIRFPIRTAKLVKMSRYITYILRFLFIIITISIYQESHAVTKDEYFLSGMVRDSLTLEPLPFASVTVPGNATGTLTNDQGIFELTVADTASSILANCLGYEKKTVKIKKGNVNLYDILLSPSTTELKEVVVHRKKYSKKNNPAVDFVKLLKERAPLTDPRRHDYYSYNKHELMSLALNDFADKDENSWLFKKFPFLWEHVDTSEISGKAILNVMVKEKASEVYNRRDPKSTKEVVTGLRQEGVDDFADQKSMQVFIEDVLGEIDLYSNDLVLLQNRFVSPLSKIAPDFYKFYLTDTVDVGGEKCIVLSFYPHNQAAFGLNGQVFVPVNDSTMFIKKVTMRTPRNINLNFIKNLYISQEFDRAPDGSRLKTHDDMTLEANLVSDKGFYVRRNIAYDNHSFNPPQDEAAIFSKLGNEIVADSAYMRNNEFWDQNRRVYVTDNEKRVGVLMQRLRSVPVYYWTEKVIKTMFTGYIHTGKPSKFDIGPVNTFISTGTVEGLRLRLGGMTTANLSKRWFARGFTAYGIKDHKWKYGAELEYSFIDKEYHSREFPVHSLRLSSTYDIDHIGQHYLYTNQDNIFLSLKRMKDYQVTYHYQHKLDYTLELRNNFSVQATLESDHQECSDWIKFIDGYGNEFNGYTENALTVQLRYAPGEKFYQAKSFRVPISQDAPVFILSHTIAPKGFMGSKFMINKTEASFMKRFWMSAFGYADVLLKGGHVWSQSPFPNLLIPNANLSYTIQPESYALMNPMEFVNDSYAAWDLTYWFNGAILNNIPIVKKLKLREVVAFRGLWGKLSDRNDPEQNPELFKFPQIAHVTRMTNRPYMEISAGLENIFKVLRVDYVWRLSYLDVPYQIDRRGLRIAVHVTF